MLRMYAPNLLGLKENEDSRLFQAKREQNKIRHSSTSGLTEKLHLKALHLKALML